MKWIPVMDYPPDVGFRAVVYYNDRVCDAILTNEISRNTNYPIW